ncbi:MAG: shikimate dehydrogenase [Acidobacteria bacterium]|nr:shikimate dehydrogenase [Acidobacteriota bacterium]
MNDGKICVSVAAATVAELIGEVGRAARTADVVEVRFDSLNEGELDVFDRAGVASLLKTIAAAASGRIVLSTFRAPEQGGNRAISVAERKAFWNAVDYRGWADLEEDLVELAAPAVKICSHHDFTGVPDNLDEIGERLAATGADVVKIAVSAADAADPIPVWKLLEKARAENRPFIPIAMGESGKWTRILGLAHGALLTYAAPGAGRETAPGQVSAADLIDVYRVRELNAETAVYGILGGNTSVSLSPHMHNAAFHLHNLNAVFVPFQVRDLDAFMQRMVRPATREIELNFRGFSVTIPHKQTIIDHLDGLDETAGRIGAVNTVRIDPDGRLTGFNTDAPGFIEPLLNSYGDLQNARVAVLGAGGAARACVFALKQNGAAVTVFARDLPKAEPLAADFGVDLAELVIGGRAGYRDFDILVNTTPLGMKGKTENQSPATAEQLRGLDLVYDLVYVPFQTALMTAADEAEVPKIGGLAMLVAQAAEQHRIWTGLEPPVKEMSRAALRRLEIG